MVSILERLQIVTPQLAEFMTLYPELNANCDLGNTSFSRVQVNRALVKYIKEHCSTAGPIIIPNKVISDLLNYPAYQEMVRRGEKTWLRQDPITRQMVQVVETNDRLTYVIVQHLLAKHFLGADPLHLHCNHPSFIFLNRHEEDDEDDTDDPSD
jgi:hypothetical protein